MATERVVTKVKYRLKNGTSTVLPLGTTSDYVQINDESGETLTQRLEAIDHTIRPRQLDILKVQAHLNDGTIEKYCKIGDYVELDPAGKGPTRFYVIGINGHNGQLPDSIYKDHIDFYGGSTAAFESFLPSANYTQGDGAQSAAWRTTTFFNDYINNSSYSLGTEIRRDFFNLGENYDSLNFAKKVVSYDTRNTQGKPVSTLLGYFGFTYTDELWAKFQQLASYEPYGSQISTNENLEIVLTPGFEGAIKNIKTNSGVSLALLRASVGLEDNLVTFPTTAADSLVAMRHSVGLVEQPEELITLHDLYMRIYNWVCVNNSPKLTSSTGITSGSWLLWMLTEEEIDNNNILGTPRYTALSGYSYPFFQNKQLFRLLFPSFLLSTHVFHSITPAEGSSNEYVSWTFSPTQVLIKSQEPAALNNTVEGFGFRLESSE